MSYWWLFKKKDCLQFFTEFQIFSYDFERLNWINISKCTVFTTRSIILIMVYLFEGRNRWIKTGEASFSQIETNRLSVDYYWASPFDGKLSDY